MRRTLISVSCVIDDREGRDRPSIKIVDDGFGRGTAPIGTSAQVSDGRMRVVVSRRGCHKKPNMIGQ